MNWTKSASNILNLLKICWNLRPFGNRINKFSFGNKINLQLIISYVQCFYFLMSGTVSLHFSTIKVCVKSLLFVVITLERKIKQLFYSVLTTEISWLVGVSQINYYGLLVTDKSRYFARHRPIIDNYRPTPGSETVPQKYGCSKDPNDVQSDFGL